MHTEHLVSISFKHGWETFKRRYWFVMGCVILAFGVTAFSGAVAQNLSHAAPGILSMLANLVDFFIVQIFVGMGVIAWSLKADGDVTMTRVGDLWAPAHYWRYLFAMLFVTLIEIIGFVLFIIPGIIAAVFLVFTMYFVVDRGMGPVEAMHASINAVRHHFWGVLFLLVAAVLANILGLIVLGVGILVSAPITMVAMAHAYRTLANMPQTM